MKTSKPDHLGAYKRLNKKIIDTISPIINKSMLVNRKDAGESLMADILGVSKNQPHPVPLNSQEHFTARVFYEFVEIANTVEEIRCYPHYISTFPFNPDKISRSSYLSMIYNSYLHELYILRERLISFIPNVIKEYKGSDFYIDSKKIAQILKKQVKNTFYKTSFLRDRHVHRYRYEPPGIQPLKTMELLLLSDDPKFVEFIKDNYRTRYKEIRKSLKVQMLDSCEKLDMILDSYSFELDLFLFEENKLIQPETH